MAAVVSAEFNHLPVLLTCSCSHCFYKARLLQTSPRIYVVGWQWDRKGWTNIRSIPFAFVLSHDTTNKAILGKLSSHPAKRGLQQSSASSCEPSSQEGTARARNHASKFQNNNPPHFYQHNTSCRSGRTKRERLECPARPPTLSSNSFLKASAVRL